jgi:hypothetical protein
MSAYAVWLAAGTAAQMTGMHHVGYCQERGVHVTWVDAGFTYQGLSM